MFQTEPWEAPVHMPEIRPRKEYLYDDFVYVIRDDGVEIVGYRARWKTIRIPVQLEGRSVVAIGGGAFMGNEALKDLIIPGSVRWIGDYAFYRCPALQLVILMEGVENIGSHAFDECSMIREVYTPCSIRQVGNDAFMDTPKLRIMGSPESAMQPYCDQNGFLLIPHRPEENAE